LSLVAGHLAPAVREDRLMPAVEAPTQGGAAPAAGAAVVPFIVGSNLYREAPFATITQLMDANSHENVVNITPGGFLRGVVLQVTSAGGVIGTGVLAADAPWSIFSALALEDISGGPVLYPMTGFAAMVKQKYFQPWEGDPAKRPGFSNTINPVFTLRLSVELRDTLCVLANTDARAQYRLRFTIAAFNPGLVSTTGSATAPTLTINCYFSAWAQPDAHDLLGNGIQQIPDGLSASRFVMHELPVLNGGANVIRHTLMGNEVRAIGWIVRNSLGARIDLTDANAGPLDFRLDNRRLWKMRPSQIIEEMNWFYEQVANGTQTRDTGVYVIPRFRDVGTLKGEYWLQTVEQSLLQVELNGTDLGGNAPGTLEIIYDELAVAGALPANLEGV
jgi:hypothetical protein